VQNTYVFFNGQRVARLDSTGAVHYYFSDHLGSHGVVENATASACEQDADYYPYGGEQNDYCTTPVPQHHKFTGKERDTESGLDNFGARYSASSMGRFMTPDWAVKPATVPYASFGDPQTLNLYAYVENGPLNKVDADGHYMLGSISVTAGATYVEETYGEIDPVSQQHQPPAQETNTAQSQPAQNTSTTVSQQQLTQNAATGAVVGGVVGGVVGSVVGGTAGGAVGTLAEPGGGTVGASSLAGLRVPRMGRQQVPSPELLLGLYTHSPRMP
jgi:RHS repeat-associated protein